MSSVAQEVQASFCLDIKPEITQIRCIRHFIKELADVCLCGSEDMDVAVGELLTNAVRHGRGSIIKVACLVTAAEFVLTVTNEGPVFDPTECKPSLSSCSGRGIAIMRSVFDEVYFGFDAGTITVRVTKNRS